MTTASKYFPNPFNEEGFTLLEVMISVSIIALIFLSLFRMQSSTIELATADKFYSISPVLARKLLLKIEEDVANWSQVKGDFGENFPGVEWTCRILDPSFEEMEFISEENQSRFKKIELEITELSGLRSYRIHTWRFIGK